MERPRLLLPALLVASVLGACTDAGSGGTERAVPSSAEASSDDVPVPASASSLPGPSPAASASPSSGAASLPAVFRGTVRALPPALASRMDGTSWHEGCPVPLEDLRLLTLRYWGLDGEVHRGPLVVNASVADDLVGVFRKLFRARFPIEELHLAGRYRPGAFNPYDRRNYTASFNCRPVVTPTGDLPTWSQHAYGLAVDVNPLRNPYVSADGFVRNRIARRFVDRSQDLPGMIHPGDVVVRAFAAIGWEWAGAWDGAKDYMHFSHDGH